MPTYIEEKKILFLELKAETLNQLKAIQAEDSESFLQSTEVCSSLMESIDSLHLHNEMYSDDLKPEMREVMQEILAIREKINILIPPLYERLKQKANTEKQINFVKRRYNLEDQPVPSIFFDKKI